MTAEPRRFLLDANGTGYENPDYRPTREYFEHYAAVMEREADARSHQPDFQATLREWAANARRKAATVMTPAQGELFG